tara:strand:+ start:757 stop:948 length:192 start_codon:yes stop_codon:yes gene_type:complete
LGSLAVPSVDPAFLGHGGFRPVYSLAPPEKAIVDQKKRFLADPYTQESTPVRGGLDKNRKSLE